MIHWNIACSLKKIAHLTLKGNFSSLLKMLKTIYIVWKQYIIFESAVEGAAVGVQTAASDTLPDSFVVQEFAVAVVCNCCFTCSYFEYACPVHDVIA